MSEKVHDEASVKKAQKQAARLKIGRQRPEKAGTAAETRAGLAGHAGQWIPQQTLFMQRSVGNREVNRLIDGAPVQAKLTVGAVHDPYEAEADRVAEQVLGQQSAPPAAARGAQPVQRQDEENEVQAKPLAAGITPLVGRQPEEEEEQAQRSVQRQGEGEDEEDRVQAKAVDPLGSFETEAGWEQRLESSRSGGSPLPAEVRSFMEPRFGADFSGVRVHSGGESANLSREISAQAFTHGNDIYLGEGKYAPGTAGGKRLLAHELAHVVQQTGGGAQRVTVRRAVWTLADWKEASALRGKRRSKGLGKIDDAVARYERRHSPDDLEAILKAIQAWMAKRGGKVSARQEAVTALMNQVINEKKQLPEPKANLANVPLGTADLIKARKNLYWAAAEALDELAKGKDQAIQDAAKGLAQEFWDESYGQAYQFDPNALGQLAEDKDAFKKAAKEIFEGAKGRKWLVMAGKPGTIGGLVERMASTLKMRGSEKAIKTLVTRHLIERLNADGRWRSFVQDLDIAGAAYTSAFTPINKEFDQTFAGRGTTGYASAGPKLPLSSKSVYNRTTATNAWFTQFAREDTAEMGDEGVLFEAFRSGTFSEIEGIKPGTMRDPNAELRKQQARLKCKDLLTAMVVAYISSKEPEERDAILHGKVPVIPVVSTALLTGIPIVHMAEWHMLNEHHAALEFYHMNPTPFDIMLSGEQKRVTASFNVINLNKAVNKGRTLGGSRGQQQDINQEAIHRLGQLKDTGLQQLRDKQVLLEFKLAAIAQANVEFPELQRRIQELSIQIAKIEQLWARIKAMKGPSGSMYELPALASNLGYQLGAMVHFNCKSGKDRTGMTDVESKLLAYQMDLRAREAVKAGIDVTKAELVPKYEADLREEEAEAAIKLIFEGGNINIQAMNAGLPGYKLSAELKTRLGRILASDRAKVLLQKYMARDEAIKATAGAFLGMLTGESFATSS